MKGDRWPITMIEEIFDYLRGAQYFKYSAQERFSALYLFTGHSQVLISECCREKTTFLTKYGTYEFLVMPFGLMNAPKTFQQMLIEVLKGLYFLRVYLDEVIVYSKTIKEPWSTCEWSSNA